MQTKDTSNINFFYYLSRTRRMFNCIFIKYQVRIEDDSSPLPREVCNTASILRLRTCVWCLHYVCQVIPLQTCIILFRFVYSLLLLISVLPFQKDCVNFCCIMIIVEPSSVLCYSYMYFYFISHILCIIMLTHFPQYIFAGNLQLGRLGFGFVRVLGGWLATLGT